MFLVQQAHKMLTCPAISFNLERACSFHEIYVLLHLNLRRKVGGAWSSCLLSLGTLWRLHRYYLRFFSDLKHMMVVLYLSCQIRVVVFIYLLKSFSFQNRNFLINVKREYCWLLLIFLFPCILFPVLYMFLSLHGDKLLIDVCCASKKECITVFYINIKHLLST